MTPRVVVVTGAGRGLGRIMALALLEAGHSVFLTSTDGESLEETRRASAAGARVEVGTADLSDESELNCMVDEALGAFGRIDMLISNAGIPSPPTPNPLDVTSIQLQRLFTVNTFAPINLIRLVTPGMVARGWGRIILMSTSLDTMLDPRFVTYGMTKAAGEAFIVALAEFLRSTGVTANVILPGGAVATRMTANIADPKVLLQPEIMAGPIRWLASDDSNAVTGRRFNAAKWSAALSPAQAAQASSAPAAWAGYGDKSIRSH